MFYHQAKALLVNNPKANVKLVTKDATREYYVFRSVWLDEDGELAMAHPTDPRGMDLPAPQDARYEIVADDQ